MKGRLHGQIACRCKENFNNCTKCFSNPLPMFNCTYWMCLVIYLYVCCCCGEGLSALGSLAADCGTSGDASVAPPGFGKRASAAPPWLPLRMRVAQRQRRPIWSAPSRQGPPRPWGRWGARRGPAGAAGRRGWAGPPWHWSAAAAGCCPPSDRRCPGRAAASERASTGSAACSEVPPSCLNRLPDLSGRPCRGLGGRRWVTYLQLHDRGKTCSLWRCGRHRPFIVQ